MCIIVVKNKGVEIPSEDIIKKCFENNPDGAGFMYQVQDYVKIEKGFMTCDKLIKRLNTLNSKLDLKDKSLIIHFRIGTSGKNDKKTTHPYPITNDTKDLRMTSKKCDLAMVHNGIISDYALGGELNDTQHYIKDYVSMLYDLNKDFLKNDKVLKNLLKTSGSKLAFLDKDDNITLVGDFIEDKGLLFSNGTYNYSRYSNYNLTSYDNYAKDYKANDYNWGYYDDYEDYEYEKKLMNEYNNKDMVKDYEDLMLLDEGLFIQYDNGNLDTITDNWYAIDKDDNLYEIIDFFGDRQYIVDLVAKGVSIFNKDYKPIEFISGYDLGYM